MQVKSILLTLLLKPLCHTQDCTQKKQQKNSNSRILTQMHRTAVLPNTVFKTGMACISLNFMWRRHRAGKRDLWQYKHVFWLQDREHNPFRAWIWNRRYQFQKVPTFNANATNFNKNLYLMLMLLASLCVLVRPWKGRLFLFSPTLHALQHLTFSHQRRSSPQTRKT